MRKVKVKAEQLVFAAVNVKASELVHDKARELIVSMPLLPKYEAWVVERRACPVSGKEVSA